MATPRPRPGPDPASARIRVAVDATPLLGQPTGVGVFCREALQAVRQRDEFDLCAFAVSWRRRGALGSLVPAGITTTQRPMPARPLHALWKRGAWPRVESFVGDVDVVHGTNFVVPPSRQAGEVVTVHDLTPLHFPQLCSPTTLAYPGLIRRALQRGAWVHAVSHFVRDEVLEAFDVPPDRVVAVAHGVPTLPVVAPDAAARTVGRLLPTGASRYILSVATAEPRKDLPGLVAAFAQMASRHRDLVLVLTGPPGWGEQAVTSAIAASGVSDRIVRTGWVDDADLSSLLGRAAVLAYPSLYEGFGFPPLQAMAAGVPVVATRTGALPEVLGDAALLVDVGDTAGLAEALARVVTDDALAAHLRAAGTARAGSYSWEACGAGLASLYRWAADARE